MFPFFAHKSNTGLSNRLSNWPNLRGGEPSNWLECIIECLIILAIGLIVAAIIVLGNAGIGA